MKVLLVNPRIDNMITTMRPPYVDEQQGNNPPLGLMYVAAYAEQHTDHKIEILDMLPDEVTYENLESVIKERKPDIVGITTTTFTLIDVMLVAKIVKATDKSVKVVLGGAHVHMYPVETIALPGVDFLVLGEGELSFVELLQNINDYESLKGIKGIVFKHKGEIINTGRAGYIENLDSLPFPSRHLTQINRYNSILGKGGTVTTMITSRGCPYNCLFCHRPHLGKKFRTRSAINVVDEMEECANMGIKEILVYDDIFTLDRQRVMDICRFILERGLDIIWDIRTRVDRIDIDMLKALKEAGCERINYGVESANPEILKVLRKGITLPQVESAFKMTKKANITTLAYFMLGSPTETREQIMNTIAYAKRLNPDYCQFTITTPYPATPLYEMGIEKGMFNDYWREFATNPSKDFTTKFWEEDLNGDELTQLLNYAYKSFYIRPKYILRQIRQICSLGGFRRRVKAGLSMLRFGNKGHIKISGTSTTGHLREFWDAQAKELYLSFFCKETISDLYHKKLFAGVMDYFGVDLNHKKLLKLDLWNEATHTSLLEQFYERGADIYGVDISPVVVGKADSKFRDISHEFKAGDIRNLPFEDNQFDIVFSLGTIEHIEDSQRAIDENFRVLKKGGIIIVGVPNLTHIYLKPLALWILQRIGKYPYGYARSFSMWDLRRMVTKAGFSDIKITGIMAYPWVLRYLDLVVKNKKLMRPLIYPFMSLEFKYPLISEHIVAMGVK